ncbi:uncharacterized protein STEHIDRAFT_116614 [Stereum hirsutum FP-91666 SS1]|uniref:Uncharacterized protein n=1 Tax=Stereum hirsutum (strain FP-91666) TaxID=721885 RepID=R7RX50_STEHR|nr:uncharacterized protein STEHIDRAFT_116614 [Stereum hirsutum FP-91666 SS1]EIM79435.1 hypothetical protein STEHIDRAFT_116614 [Stereum hirsutum FP-91666 SS1]
MAMRNVRAVLWRLCQSVLVHCAYFSTNSGLGELHIDRSLWLDQGSTSVASIPPPVTNPSEALDYVYKHAWELQWPRHSSTIFKANISIPLDTADDLAVDIPDYWDYTCLDNIRPVARALGLTTKILNVLIIRSEYHLLREMIERHSRPIYAELPTVLEIAAILKDHHSVSSSAFPLVTKWGPSVTTIVAIASVIVEGPEAAEDIERNKQTDVERAARVLCSDQSLFALYLAGDCIPDSNGSAIVFIRPHREFTSNNKIATSSRAIRFIPTTFLQ